VHNSWRKNTVSVAVAIMKGNASTFDRDTEAQYMQEKVPKDRRLVASRSATSAQGQVPTGTPRLRW